MNHSESLIELFKALSKAQGEIKPALKDATNPHLRSKYADLGSVWEACREALANNGLSVSQWPITSELPGITLMTVLGHASGEYMMAAYTMPTSKNDAQSYGSALTYAKRYALSAVLGIVADDDDDGHAASQAPQNRQQAAPRQNTRPAPAQGQQQGSSAPETLTPGQAQTLHKRLGAALSNTAHREMSHNEYAARVLKRPVTSLTELTVDEAKQVQQAADSEAQNAA